MADFLRPEAKAALWRWREVAGAMVVAALGLWWAMTSLGALSWLGGALVLVGLALGYTALQRLRFGRGGGGPGVVTADERRLTYFGPLTGGEVDLDDLSVLEYDPTARPPHWLLRTSGGQILAIPVSAEGADTLFDHFAALPELKAQTLLDVLSRTPPVRTIVWRRPAKRLH